MIVLPEIKRRVSKVSHRLCKPGRLARDLNKTVPKDWRIFGCFHPSFPNCYEPPRWLLRNLLPTRHPRILTASHGFFEKKGIHKELGGPIGIGAKEISACNRIRTLNRSSDPRVVGSTILE